MAMELIAHQIAIIRAIKGVIKLPKTADIITADTEKFQHKNHFYHHGENGKKN